MRRMGIPRLELEQLPTELAAALHPRVQRLGYLGEFFKCAAQQPAALLSFMRFTDDLKGALPDNVSEVVALTVAVWSGNTYERNQHEQLARKLGFSAEWTRAVETLRPDEVRMAETERQVQRFVLAVLNAHGHGVQAQLDAVIGTFGAAQAVAVLLLIGRYVTHALFVNALQLAPPVPSTFDEPTDAITDEHR